MAVTTPYLNATEKKHWWLTNRKVRIFHRHFNSQITFPSVDPKHAPVTVGC